jgi:4-oxalocrotonate tautomerase
MPYVNIKVTREGDVTSHQKALLIEGVTDVLHRVLGKPPATTFVVIDEVELENWGVGGLPVPVYRSRSNSSG